MNLESYYDRVRTAYDGIAARYDESVGRYAVSRRAKQLALDTIRDLTPPGGAILDIGCYTGIEAIALAGEGFQVTGLDLSPEMIARAQTKARAKRLEARTRFAVLRAGEIGLYPAEMRPAFDTAYSVYGTLNLEPQIDPFKTGLHSLLREGGAFVCGLLNPTVLYELLFDPLRLDFRGYRKLRKKLVRTRVGLGTDTVDSFLYTPREFAARMQPEFRLQSVRGLHILYPPPRGATGSDLWWVARMLDGVEKRVEQMRVFSGLGFFSLMVFRRAASG